MKLGVAIWTSLAAVGMLAALPPVVAASPTQIAQAAAAKKGAIEGVVCTEEAQPIAGASVQAVKQDAAHLRLETTTDAQGRYRFLNLEPGEWTLYFSAPDLLASQRTLVVHAGEERSMPVTLEAMEAADVVHVHAERTLLNKDVTEVGTHIDSNLMRNYGTGNNLRKVIETAPGVMPDSMGNIVTRGEHNAVNYIIDGVQLPEAAGVLQQSQPVSPRSLQSADVDIGGFQASEGGAPMGAVVNLHSLPISAKPVFKLGTQLGGPIQGGVNYYASSALSQDQNSKWNRVRVESSGNVFGSKLGLQPPAYRFRRDARFDLNSLTKLTFDATNNDRFSVTLAINETFLHQPTKISSRAAGYKVGEHDRQNYFIASYKHKFNRFLDEANLHIVNAFYSQRIGSTTVFDPTPIVNGDSLLQSAAFQARRFNYALSIQGDVCKSTKTHHLLAGFLTELRPVRTRYNEWRFNADPNTDPALAPYGALISPFTQTFNGPQFQGIGNYKGFRYIQSAYLQDTWRPSAPVLRRLTVNLGVRADLYHGVFGSSTGIMRAVMAAAPGMPFNPEPFQRHTVTNAQVSGRFAGNYQLTKTTLLKASFSQLFTPPPVDIMVLPFDISGGPQLNGIFNGAPRPLQANRGYLIDAGIEQQVTPRLALRQNLFFKQLKNFGDSGVVNNTIVYNRLSLAKQQAQGLETRLELKPARDGSGVYGFLSNTIAVARLMGNKRTTGGIWDTGADFVPDKYVDHDRRDVLQAALGWKGRNGFWVLTDLSYFTGYKDDRDPLIYGAHRARTRPVYQIGLNAGYAIPPKVRKDRALMPTGVEVRIENLTNYTAPINLGSPYQGTRYQLPIRVLAGVNWAV